MKNKNTIRDMLRKIVEIVIPVLFVVLLYYVSGIGCPIKFLTGISCAGCGMSRAYFALIHGDISGAFYYHPLFPIPPLFLVLFYFRNRIGKLFKPFCAIIIALFVVVYLYRMITGGQDIVVFYPENGFIFQMDRLLLKAMDKLTFFLRTVLN